MKTRKPSSSPKRNRTQKRHARTSKKRATTWADPTVRKTRVSRGKKTKLNKNDMKKKSCWWFG